LDGYYGTYTLKSINIRLKFCSSSYYKGEKGVLKTKSFDFIQNKGAKASVFVKTSVFVSLRRDKTPRRETVEKRGKRRKKEEKKGKKKVKEGEKGGTEGGFRGRIWNEENTECRTQNAGEITNNQDTRAQIITNNQDTITKRRRTRLRCATPGEQVRGSLRISDNGELEYEPRRTRRTQRERKKC